MRTVLLSAVLGLAATTPASACPRGVSCVVMRAPSAPSVGETVGPARTVRTVSLRLARPVFDESQRAVSFEFSAPGSDGVEMPWIWAVLKREVYQRMPRYEQEHEFSLVLAPVVVSGSFDTIPGLGVAGDF